MRQEAERRLVEHGLQQGLADARSPSGARGRSRERRHGSEDSLVGRSSVK